MPPATMVEIQKFFGIPLALFRKEWSELAEADKEQLRQGIGNGSLTY